MPHSAGDPAVFHWFATSSVFKALAARAPEAHVIAPPRSTSTQTSGERMAVSPALPSTSIRMHCLCCRCPRLTVRFTAAAQRQLQLYQGRLPLRRVRVAQQRSRRSSSTWRHAAPRNGWRRSCPRRGAAASARAARRQGVADTAAVAAGRPEQATCSSIGPSGWPCSFALSTVQADVAVRVAHQ